jgi:hypothetical protein
MKIPFVIATLLPATMPVWAGTANHATLPTVPGSCHATFNISDARALAIATPNARAFVEDYGATLETSIHSQTGSTANITVTATDPRHGVTEVGVYTVSLRTGKVTDDDMEPAEDEQTAAVRNKLLLRHCPPK